MPTDRWLRSAQLCQGEMSPLRLLPQHPGLLSAAEQRGWPSPASLAGEKNGEIEVRISSLFHESHGRSNQARTERSSTRACGQKQLPACAGCCHSRCEGRGPGLEAEIQRKAVKELGTGALCLAFARTRRHACSPEGQRWSQARGSVGGVTMAVMNHVCPSYWEVCADMLLLTTSPG